MRVTGRVRHPVECLPTTGTFAGGGNACTLYLVGMEASRFSAAVTGRPDWLTAEVAPEPELGGRPQARLVLTRTAAKPAEGGTVRVTVTADDGPPFELEVPVLCPVP